GARAGGTARTARKPLFAHPIARGGPARDWPLLRKTQARIRQNDKFDKKNDNIRPSRSPCFLDIIISKKGDGKQCQRRPVPSSNERAEGVYFNKTSYTGAFAVSTGNGFFLFLARREAGTSANEKAGMYN